MNLRTGRAAIEDGTPAAALVDGAIAEVRESLAGLRELARHPSAGPLRAGPRAARRVLAARAPVPVEFVGRIGGRLPTAVEAAAYFVVSEALTNVARYAQADHATTRLERDDGRLVLEVSDDGPAAPARTAAPACPGRRPGRGARRRLDLRSPVGEGTCLRVRLPCR